MARKRTVENTDYAAMVRRMLTAYGRRVADGDSDDLAELLALRHVVDALIAPAIGQQMLMGRTSWADVGRAAGIPKGNAHRKWATEVENYVAATGYVDNEGEGEHPTLVTDTNATPWATFVEAVEDPEGPPPMMAAEDVAAEQAAYVAEGSPTVCFLPHEATPEAVAEALAQGFNVDIPFLSYRVQAHNTLPIWGTYLEGLTHAQRMELADSGWTGLCLYCSAELGTVAELDAGVCAGACAEAEASNPF